MRHLVVASSLLLASVTPARAQLSVSIGIEVPVFPELVLVPGYPVYYAPQAGSNYFFYDGVYWVYQGDSWYASSWYDGPWEIVEPEHVPLYVLRVPVRYYRVPPPYFRAWRPDAPPRWGERWGHGWERHHRGWDRWDRGAAPRPAPLPYYQRQYAGDRYPRSPDQQRRIGFDQYRYRPREAVARERFEHRGPAGAPPHDPGRPPPFRQRPVAEPQPQGWGRPDGPDRHGPDHRMNGPGPQYGGGPSGPGPRMDPQHGGRPYGPGPRMNEPPPQHGGPPYGPGPHVDQRHGGRPFEQGPQVNAPPPQRGGPGHGPPGRAHEPQYGGQEQRGGDRGQGRGRERGEDEQRGRR